VLSRGRGQNSCRKKSIAGAKGKSIKKEKERKNGTKARETKRTNAPTGKTAEQIERAPRKGLETFPER